MLTSHHLALSEFRAAAVVVGASAGAVTALNELLPPLPRNLSVPVIIVVHLPSRRPSTLPVLFAGRCALPVREPHDKQPIEPGIWFAPHDYHLLIEPDRSFAFSVGEPVAFSRPSIDVLFDSAARCYGTSLLGVVLTGSNEDGAEGACAIRELGGVVAVQDPRVSEYKIMPEATIARAGAQIIGTVSQLSAAVIHAAGGQRE